MSAAIEIPKELEASSLSSVTFFSERSTLNLFLLARLIVSVNKSVSSRSISSGKGEFKRISVDEEPKIS